ncbi:MAG: adenosylcobinamide-GDP ribazoletransferase [Methanosarcinales archaeon]|nr:adenosylcobinamide-GDP ribazoletransferase [Methanosarcinales archaeon]
MRDVLFALRSGFGFLSTIPVGISMEGIEALMRHLYVFPLVGAVLGLIFGAVAYLGMQALPPTLAAVLVLVAIYRVCGINHIDGLADFGDGVTAHGTLEKKLQAMKDVNLGTGGGVFIALILIAMFSLLTNLDQSVLPLALVAAEVTAKQSMIAFASFSAPMQKGLGQMMIQKAGIHHFVLGLLISSLVCLALLGLLGLAMLIAGVVSSLYLVLVSRRNFGGGSGDGLGAANEIARAVSLAAALALAGVLPWMLW